MDWHAFWYGVGYGLGIGLVLSLVLGLYTMFRPKTSPGDDIVRVCVTMGLMLASVAASGILIGSVGMAGAAAGVAVFIAAGVRDVILCLRESHDAAGGQSAVRGK